MARMFLKWQGNHLPGDFWFNADGYSEDWWTTSDGHQWRRGVPGLLRPEHCIAQMDLSPLLNYFGVDEDGEWHSIQHSQTVWPKSDGAAARTIWHMSKPGPIVRTLHGEEEYKRQIAEWEKHEPPPAQTTLSPWTKVTSIKVTGVTSEPTPSPLDKALEDFVAKRKAKRVNSLTGHDWPQDSGLLFSKRLCRKCGLNALDIRSIKECDGAKAAKRCDQLGRAMSLAAPHHTEIHERLMPYRGKDG